MTEFCEWNVTWKLILSTLAKMILSVGLEIERRKTTRKRKLRAVRQEIWTKVNHKSRSILKKLGNFSSKKDDEEVK